ncbi:hypothetical protein LINPERPRIM_LOCUS37057 [Linum perenne]
MLMEQAVSSSCYLLFGILPPKLAGL